MRSSKSLGDESQDSERIFSISHASSLPPSSFPGLPLALSDPRLCEQTSEQNSKDERRSRNMFEPAVAERLHRRRSTWLS